MLQRKAARYMLEGVLYRKGFLHPLLRCLSPSEAEYVMREIHEGICCDHLGSRFLTQKTSNKGTTGLQSKKTHTSWFAHVIPTREIPKSNGNQQNPFKSC
ncbi:reverse transcriptase [Gossypium australe]|uniref:Reverse transcriptase n=1 Tax=Gossypium australe TaxID=47621 RepID=A0A5B6WMY6_9ROSI|nr:reverse transcriptase [Gossypium australe]